MIMAKPKSIEEIIKQIEEFDRVLIAGCDGCVTVCEAGGLKEVQVLASSLRLYFTKEGKRMEIEETSLTRQCDKDYLRELLDTIDNYDAVVSLACGAGVQFMAEMYHNKPIFPGVDTCFIGVTEERGVWSERCQACGQCILATTGGICPVSRCSKRMLNGPCGGSEKGKCEVDAEIDCGWHLIYERLKELGQLERFEQPTDPKDWASSRDGGPRKIVREDVKL
ncbi:MAG: methylenetetrahydrofolate reductase C-terminal domain-containing protein [Deltaproteobacteria bacterium]|nr:methylenetetrahydrofolate reductase C-terminal domain-containing protein [Deltaproteobacteria bacterium]MBW2070560.1 methylenetetrahydrofolate reductase C-terminal domain-containing protein [Deltaproteobacteria bacterium]